MNKVSYKLAKGQFLSNIEPFKSNGIPSNSIIHKKIPGCGATTLELTYNRNSIIIEPNVPVIIGKCEKTNQKKRKHKKIMGVYEGVDVSDIKYYLENRPGFKKILTTPEGFAKVKEAIGESIYANYFLLFDECEKTIQDIDFRDSIIEPIDDFFKFDKKAFVSATPIIPSDPRFKEFTQVVIEPDYNFKEDIHVFTTNNIIYQLKQLLDFLAENQEQKERKCFVFIKSIGLIKTIIKNLKLEDCAVYCSDNGIKDLNINGIENIYSQVNNKLRKFNFFTSRFFSAVDIDYFIYKCDPIIIMVSDVKAVQHSVIDPMTEAIQICGRFRQPEDKSIEVRKDIFHISNYNSKLTNFGLAEVNMILKDKEAIHQFITKFKPTSDIEYFDSFIDEILDLNGFSCFLRKSDSSLNYFMIDNWTDEERVKGYYQTPKSLIEEYRSSEHFEVAANSGFFRHILTDEQLRELSQSKNITINDFVGQRVKEIMNSETEDLWKSASLIMLRFSYPEPMRVIDAYGLENARALDYNINQIQKQLKESKGLSRLLPIIKFIQRNFVIGQKYTSIEIEQILLRGIKETGLSDLKPNVNLLRNAVCLSERCNVRKDENGNWLKGYEILGFVQKF